MGPDGVTDSPQGVVYPRDRVARDGAHTAVPSIRRVITAARGHQEDDPVRLFRDTSGYGVNGCAAIIAFLIMPGARWAWWISQDRGSTPRRLARGAGRTGYPFLPLFRVGVRGTDTTLRSDQNDLLILAS